MFNISKFFGNYGSTFTAEFVEHFWQTFAKFSIGFFIEVFVKSLPMSQKQKNRKVEFPDFFFAIFKSTFLSKLTLQEEKVYPYIIFWTQLA